MTTKLARAFAELRKNGFLARQNYLCCQNCAGCAMSNTATEKVDAGADKDSIKGCVFYHRQDADNRDAGQDFYLAYGPMDTVKYGIIGLSNEEVGKIVVDTLTKHGVETVWDGGGGTRIKVKVATYA